MSGWGEEIAFLAFVLFIGGIIPALIFFGRDM